MKNKQEDAHSVDLPAAKTAEATACWINGEAASVRTGGCVDNKPVA